MNIPGHEKGWLSIVDKSVPETIQLIKTAIDFQTNPRIM